MLPLIVPVQKQPMLSLELSDQQQLVLYLEVSVYKVFVLHLGECVPQKSVQSLNVSVLYSPCCGHFSSTAVLYLLP
jgi:hypothetical protein